MKNSPSPPRPASKPRRTVSIVGTGSYAPERILTNQELEQLVDTSDEWIRSRTGIRERRIAADNEATSDLAIKAAQAAMLQAEVTAAELDLIVVATVTPDTLFPATACWVQRKLGAINAACFDVSAACSGFIYALEIAQQFISTHVYDTILIIGADKLSAITDWTDRNTCVLFGDGAGAAVLRNRANSHGVISSYMGSDGAFTDILVMPGGGSRCPITPSNVDQRLNTIKMVGKEVYKQAVTSMFHATNRVLEDAGLRYEDISCVIPHQANLRIIEAIAERMHLPLEKFFVNLDRYGNTSAAAVAIALDEANRSGRVQRGDYVLLVAFGGGLTWASSVIQW
ncbi:MAG: ketoacyl-ACP synthase III [Verrucomicrobia bacterium]|nr:ketoacyl-ACP synthase III [Verrucomicrobiota bacterium]